MKTRYLSILSSLWLTACTQQLALIPTTLEETEEVYLAPRDQASYVSRLIYTGDLTAFNRYIALYQQDYSVQNYVQQVRQAREQRCAQQRASYAQRSFTEQAQYREACPAWLLQTPSLNNLPIPAPKPVVYNAPVKPRLLNTTPPTASQVIIANMPHKSAPSSPQAKTKPQPAEPIAEDKVPPLLDLLSNKNHRKSGRRSSRRTYSR